MSRWAIYTHCFDSTLYVSFYTNHVQNTDQWEFQDPKMEVLYHIRPYFAGIFSYIGLIYALYMVGTSNFGSWHGHWTVLVRTFLHLRKGSLLLLVARRLPYDDLQVLRHFDVRGDACLLSFTDKKARVPGFDPEIGGILLRLKTLW